MKKNIHTSVLPTQTYRQVPLFSGLCLFFPKTARIAGVFVVAMLGSLGVWGQTNPTAQSVPYALQTFGTSTFNTMPTGWAAWNGFDGNSVTTQTLAEASTPSGNATLTGVAAAQTGGGVYGYAVSSNARPYIQTSSNATNGANQLALAINTTGVTGINVTYDVEIISAQPRTIGVVMQYRVGTSGAWTTVSGTGNPYSQAGGTTGVKANVAVKLPAAADNQPVVQLRWATWRGTESGASSGAAIDNVSANTSFSTDHFRSRATGNWTSTGTWESSHDGTNWFNATLAPTSAANTITIRNGHTVTSTGALSIDQVTVDAGGILATDAILTNSGNLNVNGSFQINQGGFATGGTFVYGAAGTLIFNGSIPSYGVNSDHVYWPTTDGPFNVTVQNTGGIVLNNGTIRTVQGTFQTTAGVTQGGTGALTCNGICQINTGGGFGFAPTYGPASTLIYNSGANPYNRGPEWNDDDNSNPGRPHHVIVQNNTTLNYPNGAALGRFMSGNLTVEAGSSFYMDYGSPDPTAPLRVAGNVTINGNLSLSGALGGDIYVGGDWTLGPLGVFTSNNRAVFLNGSGIQNLENFGSGAVSFPYLRINKPSGSVDLYDDLNITEELNFEAGNLANIDAALAQVVIEKNTPGAVVRSGSGHVLGILCRAIANGNNTYAYPVGTSAGYTPVSIAFTGASGASPTVCASSYDGDHPQFTSYALSQTKYISRYWDIVPSGINMTSANATFTFLAGDRQGGVLDSELKAAKYDNSWTYPTTTTGTLQFTATGMTSFSEFMAGACNTVDVEASSNSPICVGGNLLLIPTLNAFTGFPTFSWEGPNGFTSADQDPTITGATALASGTYTVTMTDGAGCTDVSSTVVSVAAQPTGPTLNVKTPNTASVCQGTNVSATFNAGAGGIGCTDSYQFSTNNGNSWFPYTPSNNISTTGATTILIQGKRDGCTVTGCTGTSFVTLASWTVNAPPNAGAITGTLSVCVGSTTTLSSTGLAGGTWSSSNGNATVGAMTGVVTGVTAGSSVITYTVTDGNGCTSSTTATVTVNARPNAGAILGGTAVCETGTLSLGSDGLPGGTWSSSNTAAATVNSASGLVAGVASGSTTITYTVTDGNGCTSATNVTITVDQTATTANPGVNQTICSDAFAVLAANTPSVGTGAWSVSGPSSSNAQFSSTSSPTATFTPAGGPGTYTLTWTITNGTCTSSNTIDIEALSCLCESSTAADAVYDDGWQTGDNDNPSNFGAWALTLSSGNGTQNGHFVGSSTVNNGCTDGTDSNSDGDINTSSRAWAMYANSSHTATALRTFAPMSVNSSLSIRMDNGCIQSGAVVVGLGLRNASGNLLAEFYFAGGTSGYTINDAATTVTAVPFTDEGLEIRYDITGTSTYTLYVRTLQTGTLYTFPGRTFKTVSGGQSPAQMNLFNSNAGSGPNSNAYFNSLSICRPCSPSTASLNGTTAICPGTSTNLTATIVDGVSPYTVVYSNGMANATATNYTSGSNINVTPSGTTTYTLVSVQDANGCFATITGGGATVTLNDLPTITASSNSPVCVGNSILLTSTPAGGSGTYPTFAWQGPNSYTAAAEDPAGFAATVAAGGTYTVTVTDGNGCTGSATTSVTVNQPPTASVAGSGPITMCDDQCVTLSANTPTIGTGAWSVMSGAPSTFTGQFTNVNAPNSKFCPVEEGDYTLIWTISTPGCPASSSTVDVTAEDCMCGTSVAHELDYDDGWQSGDTDGGVFAPWTLGTTSGNSGQNGHFVGSSVGNNGCGAPGDSNNDGDIDLYGEAWGLYANTGQTADAVRPFSSPLGANGSFTVNMDNGCVQSGGTVGLALRNASGNVLAEFYFVGGDANYTVNDAATGSSGVGFTDEGLRIRYTVTGLSTYDLQITNLATGAITNLLGRTFKNPAGGQAPAQVRLFNANAGSGNNNNLYFNELRLCPGCPVYTATLAGTTNICSGTTTNLAVTMSDGAPSYTVVYRDGTNDFTVTGYSSGDNIPVTPTSTTTYTLVSVEDMNGCPGVPGGSAMVTVRTAPTITAANNGPVCAGNNIALTSTPASGSGTYTSFSWSGPNGYSASVEDPAAFAATAMSGGTYTVVVTDSDGCTGSSTTLVTVNPLPNAGTISGTLSVCIGSTTTLSSDGTSGGAWSSSNGNATVDSGTGVVTGVTTGTSVIAYTVTDGNGCVSTAMTTVTVNPFIAATPVFTETMGTVGSTTAIATHDSNNGFDNDGFTMTGTGDVRNTQNSTGYTGASGDANVFLTSGGTRTFEIAGINTTAFSNLVLSFGVYKSNTSLTGSELLVEVSSNGTTYTPLSFTALGSSADWYYRTATGTIPATANLRIRFTNTVVSTHQFRIDDVMLVGDAPTTGSITPAGPTTFCQGGSVNLMASAASSWLWSTGAMTQTIAATTAGTYTVQLTSTNGCTTVAGPVTVMVNSLPSAAPAPTSVCVGSSTTVNGNPSGGSGTYTTHTWTNLGTGTATGVTLSNTNQQTVTVNATAATAGTANLRYQVTDNNGCSTSATVTVTVNARPSAAPAPTPVCTGSMVNVNGNPSGGTMPYTAHTWTDLGTGTATGYTLSNTNQQTVTVDASTATAGTANLRYQVTDNNGCTRTADVTVTINAFNVAYALFTETMGNISSNPTTIAAHEAANGFDNDPLTMTGTGELRNTSVSSGYTGASGSANVFLTNSGTPNFQIAGINTVGLNPVSISFGVKKEANDQDGSGLRVEYSTDGVGYTTLGFPTLPTGSGTTTSWHYVTVSGAIPAASNLRIRFTNLNLVGLTSNQFRIDDIALNISSSDVAITPSGATTFCTGNNVILTSSVASSYLWSTTAVTQGITVNASSTYTVIATDGNGCTKSASQAVSVQPQPVGPTLNAKTPNTATVCQGTSVSATINPGTGGVGCSDTYEYSTNNGTSWLPYTPGNNISTTGATVVLIQAKRDGCTSGTGCTGTSFVQLASWTVNTAPAFTDCPTAPIVVGTDPSTACSAVVNYVVSASGSPTPDLTYAFSGDLTGSGGGTGSGTTFPRGTTNVVVTAANVCGAPACSFTVIVNDDDAPSVTCPPNPTIAVNSNTCQITIPDYVASLAPTDNCTGTITEAQSIPAGAYGPVSDGQVVTVTYTATDVAGNTRYCTVLISVSAPEIDVQGNGISISDGDNTPDLADHTNFGGTVIGVSLTRTFTIRNTGTQNLTLSGIAWSGTHFSVVTPNNTILPGQSTSLVVTFSATALGLFSSTISINNNDCDENPYSFAISATVGCIAADITTCPTTQTVNAAPGLCSALANFSVGLAGTPTPDVTYTLSGATSGSGSGTGSGLSYNVGTTTVSLSATNQCGADNCSFTVIVVDNQPPVVTCPSNIVRSTDANQCNAVVAYSPTLSENCPGTTYTYTFSNALTGSGSGTGSGATFPVGTTTIALKATDGAGATSTCQFTVTVNDTQLPTITCPANIVRNNDANLCGAVVTYAAATATDNCGTPTVVQTSAPLASGSTFPVGTSSVAFRATDASGNSTACTLTVTVSDTQAPNITCPANQIRPTNAGTCVGSATYTATTSDNCTTLPFLSYSFSGATTVAPWAVGIGSGSNFNKGITTVTLRATDGGGLTRTCTFRIIVSDTEAPTLVNCNSPAPVNAAANGCTAVVTYATPTFTDNCAPTSGTAVRISGPASGSTMPVGNSNVIFQATDAAGNTRRCTMTITVIDNQPPVVSCPPNMTVVGSGSPCVEEAIYPAPTASDNCDGVLTPFLASGLASGSIFPVGVTTNTWRAITANGQTGECSFTVTVTCATNKPAPSATALAFGLELGLAPNPAQSEVAFNISNLGDATGHLLLFDALGRLLWQQRIAEGQTTGTFDVSAFADGLYQVSLRTNKGVVTKGLVVAKN